jgi:SOS-response transcriptional repressor LexA
MMNRAPTDSYPDFTPRQGQYLAFIHAYTLVNARPPAEADMQRFFRVTPPSVHQMVVALERAGWISRKPGVARSIAVLVERSALPVLNPGHVQPVKITVQRYWWIESKSPSGKFTQDCIAFSA